MLLSVRGADMAAVRTLRCTHPQIPKVFLMDIESRELSVQAFRSGARGLFCLGDSSFQLFCECIERVHHGEIFATTEQLNYLLDSICQVPFMRVVSANGDKLLVPEKNKWSLWWLMGLATATSPPSSD